MPVDATQVTELFCYGLPGPPQTFSAKEEALPEVALTTMYDHRAYRRRRTALSALLLLLKGLAYAGSR